jgi:hypothetical protein
MEDYGLGDITRPTLSSVEFGTFADDTLIAIFSENLQQDSIPIASAFTLTEDGSSFAITSVKIGHDTLYIRTTTPGEYGSEYRLAYTPGTPALQDSAENPVAAFSNRLITNNFEAPPAAAPAFLNDGHTYAWLKADAANITMGTGVLISKWADVSGNGNDFAPDGSIREWDAVNEEVDVVATAVEDRLANTVTGDSLGPITVFMVVRINSYLSNSTLFGLNHNPYARILQQNNVNGMTLYAGSWNVTINNVGSGYGILTAVVNSTSSSLQWNDLTPATGNAGSIKSKEFFIGDLDNSTLSSFKEIIIRDNVATAQNIIDVKDYFNEKYGLGL